MEHFDEPAPTRSVSGDSERLRENVEHAAALIADGQEDDAISLLRAALEAGYPGADARVLLGEILLRRGDPTGRTLLEAATSDPTWGDRAQASLRATRGTVDERTAARSHAPQQPRRRALLGPLAIGPFSHTNRLPPTVARVMAEADADVARGRLESALDLTVYAETLAPEDLSLFVRHAELLVATQRPAKALTLADTIGRLAALRGETEHDLALARVVAHAAPTLDNVLGLARASLAAGDASLSDTYVPAAAAALLEAGNQPAALELAREWYTQAQGSPLARLIYVRELLRAGQVAEAADLTQDVGFDAASIVAALAVAAATGAEAQWSLIARLARDAASGRVDRIEAQRLLSDVAAVLPAGTTMPVLRALLALAVGDAREVTARLTGFRPADRVSAFVAEVCTLRSQGPDADAASVLPPLRAAFDLAAHPDVAAFVAEHSPFDPPVTAASLGESLAKLLVERGEFHEALAVYERLLKQYPDNHRYARAHAELVGRAGETAEALAQLDALREQEEAAGRHAEAEKTLETMVRIAPNHLPLRERLVEVHLKRGRLAEALRELFTLAQLLERYGRAAEAIAHLRRAAEIATLTGDWEKVEPIYDYMIRLAPEDIGLRHAAAATFVQHGRIAEAKAQLQDVVKIASTQEDYDEAIAALHQIIALDPADPTPYHRLGEILAAVGEYGQAERVYGRLAQLVPDDPAIKAKQAALAALAKGQP